jgi:cell division protein FtsI (penicillin-binding protein 3)
MSNIRRKKSEKLGSNSRFSFRSTVRSWRHRPAKDRSIDRNSTVAPLLTGRIAAVWIALGLAALGLVARLIWLQAIDSPNLTQQAQARQSGTERPVVPRRTIIDRLNNQVAIDTPSYTLYVRPSKFSEVVFGKGLPKSGLKRQIEPLEMAQRLAPILDQDVQQLAEKFQTKDQNQVKAKTTAVLISTGLREGIGNRIKKLKLEGVDLQQSEIDYTRVYPQDDMLAEILGYIGFDEKGEHRQAKAGIEYSQSLLLKREVKSYQLTRTAKGKILPDRATPDYLYTDDLKLKLTVDIRLQRASRQILKQQMEEWKAKRGTVIVMDADTGALRSLVVEPTYDPNNVSKSLIEYAKAKKVDQNSALSLLQNWAVTEPCEPGSTFKPIAVAIALENGVIKPSTIINDPGFVIPYKGEQPIKNSHFEKYGNIDIAKVLEVSSNVGMVKIMKKLEPDVYYNWIQRIGLGQKYGIDLPTEGQGAILTREKFKSLPVDRANNSFGQGFTLTPMQLVTLSASLANGGKLVTPHVVEGLFDSSGVRKDKPTLPAPIQIFSPATAESVLTMMETVVTKGSGKLAQIPGYRIAGKTGTAQQSVNGGYGDKRQKITSFIGILPVDAKRRYIVFAAVDRPKGLEKALGSTVAAPIVKSVMESLISIEGIPPSDPDQVGKKPKVIK